MSFTRFHDDPARIQKQLQEMTGIERYQLNRPGPGIYVPFVEDPHIRLQQWGANLHNNTANLEADLIGINRKLRRDKLEYNLNTPNTTPIHFKTMEKDFTDESRTTHPAWMFRDIEQTKWGFSFHDVQSTIFTPFENNQSTRIMAKDSFRGR